MLVNCLGHSRTPRRGPYKPNGVQFKKKTSAVRMRMRVHAYAPLVLSESPLACLGSARGRSHGKVNVPAGPSVRKAGYPARTIVSGDRKCPHPMTCTCTHAPAHAHVRCQWATRPAQPHGTGNTANRKRPRTGGLAGCGLRGRSAAPSRPQPPLALVLDRISNINVNKCDLECTNKQQWPTNVVTAL